MPPAFTHRHPSPPQGCVLLTLDVLPQAPVGHAVAPTSASSTSPASTSTSAAGAGPLSQPQALPLIEGLLLESALELDLDHDTVGRVVAASDAGGAGFSLTSSSGGDDSSGRTSLSSADGTGTSADRASGGGHTLHTLGAAAGGGASRGRGVHVLGRPLQALIEALGLRDKVR